MDEYAGFWVEGTGYGDGRGSGDGWFFGQGNGDGSGWGCTWNYGDGYVTGNGRSNKPFEHIEG